MIAYLHHKWLLLRLYRTKSSFMYDYRILQNVSHIMRKAP
ncbi:YlcG family protein [Erwinia sorbitola]|uniref:YlcG family protein n=1 Tax=Erwinia sorbitola TaxID=2681984 RepID=A0A6I6EBF3_9GAMM|nr:YlcG family protein [Erwinia sorbitola]QGU87064.1 YlcG family protein [Erwinia sorbitola]